jgi:DNA polymerase I-like protein with 3'-5' exonuclease and polymerase domains
MRPLPPIPEWVKLEHDVARILTNQELHGWYFDERAAWQLASSLRKELEETHQLLRNRYPFVAGSLFTPKRDNRTTGYVKGAEFTRLTELNPQSRDHIAWILQTLHGWKPTQLTATLKPIIDETVLREMAASGGPSVALEFLKCLDITKSLGMISEGTNAWLKLCTTANRIHHHCSVATVTHRCAHRNPNLGQTKSDPEFRKLFQATPGQVMVGADLASIELKLLGHYLSPYDGGRYADILLNGDIHQVNADALKVTRRQVKTISYCFTYGGGNIKLGHTFDPQLNEEDAKAKGADIRKEFVKAIPGLDRLLKAIKEASKKGYIKSLDGRHIKVDSPHKALNSLLQSSSAVIAKRWLVITNETIKQTGLCASQLAFIHDELQYECTPEHAADLSTSLVYSACRAGEYYNLRVPIEAEAKQGRNWAEVH